MCCQRCPGHYLHLCFFSQHECAVWNAAPPRRIRLQVLECRIPARRWLLLAKWGPARLWESGCGEKNRHLSLTRLQDFWPHLSWRAADAGRHKFPGTHTRNRKLQSVTGWSVLLLNNMQEKDKKCCNYFKRYCDLDTNHDFGAGQFSYNFSENIYCTFCLDQKYWSSCCLKYCTYDAILMKLNPLASWLFSPISHACAVNVTLEPWGSYLSLAQRLNEEENS